MVESLCRICEHTSPYKLVNIFGAQGKQLKLSDKIHFYLPILVKQNDKLPLGVCVSCLKALKICDDLYQTSLSTDSHLREVFLKEDLSQFCASEINTIDLKKRSKTLVEAIQEAGKSTPDPTKDKGALPEPATSSHISTKSTTLTTKISSSKARKDAKFEVLNGDVQETNGDSGAAELGGEECGESDDSDDDGREEGDSTDSSNSESDDDGSKNEQNKTCDLCPETFRTGVDLSRHRKTHSAEERLKCKECGKIFPNDTSYNSHIKIHKGVPVKCEVCEAILSSKMYLKRHMIIHEPPKFCCTVCGKTARNMQKLLSHMVSHSDERPFPCKLCGQKFKTLHTLRQHEAIHSDTPTHVCDICGRAFHRKNHLDRHVQSHVAGTYKKTKSRLSCSVCTMTYTTDENLKKHIETAHGGEAVPQSAVSDARCEICDQVYPSRSSLASHKFRVHGVIEKPSYKCSICGDNLTSKRSLDYHIFGHSGEKPFQCKICNLPFKAREPRDRHERKHTNDRPFKCKFCGKSFLGYSTLCQHQAIHSAEKKHKCDMCPYKTHRPAALRIHLLSHTGEKPYSCSICGKSYRASWDLTLHTRAVHNGETLPRRIRQRPKKSSDRVGAEIPPPDREESSNSNSAPLSLMQL